MDISKTIDHIKIMIKMPNLSQEPPGSSKAPNQDWKDMDILCTFKIKIDSQKSDHGCIKARLSFPAWNIVSKVSRVSSSQSLFQEISKNLSTGLHHWVFCSNSANTTNSTHPYMNIRGLHFYFHYSNNTIYYKHYSILYYMYVLF